jgi:hypothetical protein
VHPASPQPSHPNDLPETEAHSVLSCVNPCRVGQIRPDHHSTRTTNTATISNVKIRRPPSVTADP